MTEVKIPSKFFQNWKEILQGLYPGKPNFTEDKWPKDLDDKVLIITGGNAGIGFEVVKKLFENTNIKIYIFARNEETTKSKINELIKENKTKSNQLNFIRVDLADLTTIKPAVDEFLKLEKRLDIIIHNAGVMMPRKGEFTKQNFELQLGVNCIAPFLLQHYLNPILISTSNLSKSTSCRIVWVASTAHFWAPEHGLYFPDPNFKTTNEPSNLTIYSQSKAISIIIAKQWSLHHKNSSVISVALCPGYLKTGLSRNLNKIENFFGDLITHDSSLGAYTEIYAALSPDVENGDYIISFGKKGNCRTDLNDVENSEKVWNYLEEQIEPYISK
ncbi:RDH2 [Candida pseudojiufengensis]|uniref:RDH2 n=1 Tax=Candida pseudojiufengensis TaxID=497109 RepID=UPI0022251E9A|nr:RDH2 [Candida pseudojiufengensis]KAI5965262.1 RDH2 [Candida pseudojiufengensis]